MSFEGFIFCFDLAFFFFVVDFGAVEDKVFEVGGEEECPAEGGAAAGGPV